jgi:hypothetical protein
MKKSMLLLSLLLTQLTAVNAQWQNTNGAIASQTVTCIVTNGAYIYAGTAGGGFYMSSNNGTIWTTINNGLTNHNLTAITVNGTKFYAATSGGGFFLSTNSGAMWAAQNNGLTNLNITSMVVIASYIFVATPGGVFRSDDDGANWSAVNTGFPVNSILCLAVSGANLFAGLPSGYGVYKSSDFGTSWNSASTGLPAGAYIDALVTSGSNIFAGTHTMGIYVSQNDGGNWAAANDGTECNAPAMLINGTMIYIGGTSACLRMNTINPGTWVSVNTGLPAAYVRSLGANSTYMFAGLDSQGVWKRLLTELSGIEEKQINKPEIYPSIASNAITIELPGLKDFQNNMMAIYNAQGQLVSQQLIQQPKTEVDISALAKGMYVIRLSNDGGVRVMKFIKE